VVVEQLLDRHATVPQLSFLSITASVTLQLLASDFKGATWNEEARIIVTHISVIEDSLHAVC
jgi:hypothetical protein